MKMENPDKNHPALDSRINRAALIVAAGKGLRVGGNLPKQFCAYKGKPLLRHSVEAFQSSGYFQRYIVVIAKDQDALANEALAGLSDIHFAYGGETRQESVRNGLSEIADTGGCDEVYIHDAARPGLNGIVLENLMYALQKYEGAVPALPVTDSLSRANEACLAETVERSNLWRIQTPQAFHFNAILDAHAAYPGDLPATDDARVAQAAGIDVAKVDGEESLHKITFSDDFRHEDKMTETIRTTVRTGMGFDVHRLVENEELWLCGIRIPYDRGLAGHSDADVALHALTDAILGALADGDIGDHFPPSDPQWKGARSDAFLQFAASRVRGRNGRIANVDLTIICEAPKIGPHRAAMQQKIADIIELDANQVSVKATTTERLGATGRGEGIAAQAVATIVLAD